MRLVVLPALRRPARRVRPGSFAGGDLAPFWYIPSAVCPLLPARARLLARRESARIARRPVLRGPVEAGQYLFPVEARAGWVPSFLARLAWRVGAGGPVLVGDAPLVARAFRRR